MPVRNERLAQLQKTLTERKQIIADLRKRQDAPTRSKAGRLAERESEPAEAAAYAKEIDLDEPEALGEMVSEASHTDSQLDDGHSVEPAPEVGLPDEAPVLGEEQEAP